MTQENGNIFNFLFNVYINFLIFFTPFEWYYVFCSRPENSSPKRETQRHLITSILFGKWKIKYLQNIFNSVWIYVKAGI